MRISSIVTIAGAALALCLPGCVAEHASAMDESKSQLATAGQIPADSSDPFGACVVDEIHPSSYPFPGRCSQGGSCDGFARLDCPPPDDSGGAFECEHAEFWSWCDHSGCASDSDCPQPATGDVTAQCMRDVENNLPGSCFMNCSEGDTCPDGFVCWRPADIGSATSSSRSLRPGWFTSVCVQYFELTNFTVPPFPSP